MNWKLTEQIIKHILSNFVVITTSNVKNSKSLMSNDYLLDKKITFCDEDNHTTYHKLWGCQLSSQDSEIKVILLDCSQNNNEYALLILLKNNLSYGLYLSVSNESFRPEDSLPMIACSLDGERWMECNTYLQATFLAAMEQTKEIYLSWNKCIISEKEVNFFKSFINFHQTIYE